MSSSPVSKTKVSKHKNSSSKKRHHSDSDQSDDDQKHKHAKTKPKVDLEVLNDSETDENNSSSDENEDSSKKEDVNMYKGIFLKSFRLAEEENQTKRPVRRDFNQYWNSKVNNGKKRNDITFVKLSDVRKEHETEEDKTGHTGAMAYDEKYAELYSQWMEEDKDFKELDKAWCEKYPKAAHKMKEIKNEKRVISQSLTKQQKLKDEQKKSAAQDRVADLEKEMAKAFKKNPGFYLNLRAEISRAIDVVFMESCKLLE